MRFLAGLENKVVRLPDGMTGEIDDMTGEITVIQSEVHAVVFKPEQIAELVSWVVVYHLGYINGKIDEAETRGARCFECREPLKTAYVYRMPDGDIELCSRCHVSVKKAVEQLQRCSRCGNGTTQGQSYTVMRKEELVEVCFRCFADIAEAEFSAQPEEIEL